MNDQQFHHRVNESFVRDKWSKTEGKQAEAKPWNVFSHDHLRASLRAQKIFEDLQQNKNKNPKEKWNHEEWGEKM